MMRLLRFYTFGIRTHICSLSWLLLFPSILLAQPSVDSLGTHVVRPGETMEGIAFYYLGSSREWKKIWEFNKEEIGDPNKIRPGTVLRFKLPETIPSQAARITKANRTVEEHRAPLDFTAAAVNDILKSLDTLRTEEGASAELEFGDETHLVLTEQTQVIIGEGPKRRQRVGRQRIQIERGQTDLQSRSRSGSGIEIEIVMGDTVVTPRPKIEGEKVQARTRRPDGQGAQLMVYGGKSSIQAAGQSIEVDEGMGTTVDEGQPPAPPEKLLAAPEAIRPEAEARFEFPNPPFDWQPVSGAEHYTLEICRDRECGVLERRITRLRVTHWQPSLSSLLPIGNFHWRVTATSPSGLDGFPLESSAFAVLSDELDRDPPRASIRFSGPMVGVGNRLVVGIGAMIAVEEVADAGTGLREWTRMLDGKPVSDDRWKSAAWSSGDHVASLQAIDKTGNQMTLEPQPFVFDPDPPIIQWGVEDGAELGRASGPSTSEIDPLLQKEDFGLWSRTTGSFLSPLIWTSSKVKWLPMEFGDWKIHSDKPFILVRARKKKSPITFSPVGESVTTGRGLWIHATDIGCGVESMSYQLLIGPQDQKVLVIEAVDALDNKSRVVWSLDEGS